MASIGARDADTRSLVCLRSTFTITATSGARIAKRSVDEIAQLGYGSVDQRTRWGGLMAQLFPDVRKGDRLTGVNVPGLGARFYFNGDPIGEIADPDFARAFSGYGSIRTINHGAWGAELSSDPVERTRITAVREALALIGVIVTSIAPTLFSVTSGADVGLQRFALAFAPFAAICLALTWLAPVPPPPPRASGRLFARVARPLSDPMFRRLLAVFLANGIASAIPATLVLFYVADVLRDEARQGWFLALYFVSGAAGMPLWLRISAQHGKTLAWSIGMVVSIASFVWDRRMIGAWANAAAFHGRW